MGDVRFSVGMTKRYWVLCGQYGLQGVECLTAAPGGERWPAPRGLAGPLPPVGAKA